MCLLAKKCIRTSKTFIVVIAFSFLFQLTISKSSIVHESIISEFLIEMKKTCHAINPRNFNNKS